MFVSCKVVVKKANRNDKRNKSQSDRMAKFFLKLMLHKQKRNVFIIAQKSLYIWATFVTQIFTQNIEKSPNLVTLPNLPKCHGDLYKLPS